MSHDEPRLMYSLTSPYSRKVIIVADEKKIEFDAVVDVPWLEGTKVPDFNPLGKVPVWIKTNGDTLFDSRVIVEYLDGLTEGVGEKLIPDDFDLRIQVKRWEAIADGVMDASLVIFAERYKRDENLRCEKWIQRQFGKIHSALTLLNDDIGDREFFCLDRLTLADISVASCIGYVDLRFSNDFDWKVKYPHLAKQYEALMERDSFFGSAPEE